jgi:2-polyprenyl-3-methyl-5-hydroxy-6-metoxy-1,4-benzoquinol methylase
MHDPEEPSCYLCEGKDFRIRPGTVRDNPELQILECISCGLVFLSSQSHIHENFYQNSGMHTADGQSPQISDWLKEAERDDERRFRFLQPLLRQKSLLDFGCGAGGFLKRAKRLASPAHGLEPEARLAPYFKQEGLEVFRNLTEIDTKYDILTLFHVLEHLVDPKQTLRDLSAFLKPKGQIIIEVPHAEDALLTLYRCEAFSHFTYWSCHLYLFTETTLRLLARQAGLQVDYIQQVQRYPLSNHLHWLAQGEPGGHQRWHFLDAPELECAYANRLATLGLCDTLLACLAKE